MDAQQASIIAAILHVSRKSGALATQDPVPTARAILFACAEWETTERSLVTPDLKESPGWIGYEMKIFNLGRALDFVMRKIDVWRGKGLVLDAGAMILADARYGRGRQSFAAALGDHGQGAYGAELVRMLTDEQMAGYAVKALTRGGYREFADEVRAATEGARTWVKNAGLAYLGEMQRGRSAAERSA